MKTTCLLAAAKMDPMRGVGERLDRSRPVVPARCAPARQWTMTFLPLAKAEPARG